MRVADDVGYAGKSGKLFGGALGVATGDNEASCGVLRVKLADGVASLGIGSGGYGTRVENDEGSGERVGSRGATEVEKLAFEGGAIGLSGAATELLDEEGGHVSKSGKSAAIETRK